MRTIAILMVVAGHIKWIYPTANALVASALDVFAFLGVEVFFVLSGFLIGKIVYHLFVDHLYDFDALKWFLKRRWWRTLPGYYLVLVINALLAWLLWPSGINLTKYFLFLQNFSSAMPAFFPESWSLSVEEFSYFLLPLVLVAGSRIKSTKSKSNFFVLVVALLIAMGFCFRWMFYIQTHNTDLSIWNSSVKPIVIYRFDSIFLGILASWFSIRFPSLWSKQKVFASGLGMVLLASMFVGVGYFRWLIDTHPIFWNVFYFPLVSLSVVFFMPFLSGWKKTDYFIARWVQWISIRSYSIYLLHYSLLMQLMKNFWVINPDDTNKQYLFTFIYLAILLILSHVFYSFYEKPMTDFRDRD
jgi:peptidoglycan/LPS O-acetylase OafA/YrhL